MYDLAYQIANPFTEVIDNLGLAGLTKAIGSSMGTFTDPLRDLPLLGPLFFEPLDAIAHAFRSKLLL
jgi:hypothetical protein